MIVALADVKCSLKEGIALGVVVDVRDRNPLGEVGRIIFIPRRIDAKDNGEDLAIPFELFQRQRYIVAGMKSQVEPEFRFARRHHARQVFTGFRRFQHRHVYPLE